MNSVKWFTPFGDLDIDLILTNGCTQAVSGF
jgi:hypothetical protein